MQEPTLKTECAHWGWAEHRYFGHAVFGELLGHENFTGLTVLSVLGRRLPAECLAVVDDMAIALTLADPRIWPLKLTRLLAAYGGAVAALGGALSCQEGARIGPWTGQQAATLLHEFHGQLSPYQDDAARVRECVLRNLESRSYVWGFGTPFRDRDERLVAFERRIVERGRHTLPHWRTFDAISRVITAERGVQPNMGMGVAAACLDLGLEVREVGPLATALMQHMFLANAVEQARAPSEALRQLPDSRVSYVGPSLRKSPKAHELADSISSAAR
jgi:hypothetical protein